ncbi:GNAT family N-acetyltransferase [Aquidulcibacter sp.]|uniref:GNAT family N-acetyltransferase n=1 Tax=Aquidulcibacter sp. TaxID=2052990 RepID=UPI0037C0A943
MSASSMLAAFDLGQRRRPEGAALPSTWAQTPQVTRDHGQIIWQDIEVPSYEEAIAVELAVARAAGAEDLEWKLYSHDQPAGLAQALEAAGFERQPTETILVRASDLGPATPVPGLEITKIQTLEQATHCFNLALQAFGNNWDKTPEDLLKRALGGEPFWLGLFEGQPVSMGRLTRTEGSGFAGLYGGASHPDYRRRGFYRPVVHARVQAAAEMGCKWVFSEALPTSEPILRALGFETLCQVTGYLYRFQD